MPAIPVAEKKEVKVGEWINEAIKLTTENLGPHLLLGLIVAVIFFIVGFTFVGSLIVDMPIMCGMFFYAKKRMSKMPTELGDIFRGFDIFVECLVASLIILVLLFIVLFVDLIIHLVVGLIGTCCPLAFLMYLPLIFASLIMLAAIYGFVVLIPGLLFERRMKAWDAIQLNINFAMKNFWAITFYGFVVCLISILGTAITCSIGIIFVIPFTMFAGTIVYREWIGFIDEAQTPTTNTAGGSQPVN